MSRRGQTLGTPGIFVATVVMLIAFGSETALACPICFRVVENATTDGVHAAVLVLMSVTVVVLGAFGRFIVGFVAREGHQTAKRQATARGQE